MARSSPLPFISTVAGTATVTFSSALIFLCATRKETPPSTSRPIPWDVGPTWNSKAELTSTVRSTGGPQSFLPFEFLWLALRVGAIQLVGDRFIRSLGQCFGFLELCLSFGLPSHRPVQLRQAPMHGHVLRIDLRGELQLA